MKKILFRFITVFLTLSSLAANAAAPVAKVSKSSNLSGTMPLLNVKLDGSLSTCPNGCTQLNSYVWDYGDTVPSQPGLVQTHEYDFAGVYTATLTITDNLGLTSTASVKVTVNLPPGETLANYVQACQTQLNFQTIPNNVDCYSGDLFQTANDFDENASVSDYMGYRKITDQVDMAFACRWLFGSKTARSTPISIEMLVHNRQNGNTCFFSAKGFVSHSNINPANRISLNPSSIITSPTAATASSFWDSPAAVNVYVRCVGCHIEGPYIATPTVAPYLAKDGLMNNGHDTGSNITNADLTQSFNTAHVKYHAISGTLNGGPGAFSQWDSLKQSYIDPGISGCSAGCHVIGTLSPQQDITQLQRGPTTILHDPANELFEIENAGAMPPSDDYSDYRWINLDTPGDGVESESFAAAKSASTTLVPKLLSNCAAPVTMEAHVVGSDNTFVVTQPSRFAFLPDRLSVFNLKDGLVCLNSDQDPGQTCSDYSVHYECTDATNTKTWTSYISHALQSDGDHESRPANVCPSGSTATGIEAAFTAVNGWTYSSIGPNDRLASFSQYGLTCNNTDQPDGQCSNYVVRYENCTTAPQAYTAHLTSVYTGRVLTATDIVSNVQSKAKGQPLSGSTAAQQWSIEPVLNTAYVRLRNVGSNTYLDVTSQAEVWTSASNASTNEEWIIEPIASSNAFRLKNLWSGKYLTIGDTSNDAGINWQTLNTSLTSQQWVIQ